MNASRSTVPVGIVIASVSSTGSFRCFTERYIPYLEHVSQEITNPKQINPCCPVIYCVSGFVSVGIAKYAQGIKIHSYIPCIFNCHTPYCKWPFTFFVII